MRNPCTSFGRRLAHLPVLLLAFTVDSLEAQSAANHSTPQACSEPLQGAAAAPQTFRPAVDLRAIATIVAGNANITPGELVLIRGGSDDLAFMEQLAVAVGALGGQPLVYVFSDATIRHWYQDVPAHFDTQRDEWAWLLLQNVDVMLEVGRRDPTIWNDLPAERLDAYDRVNQGLDALIRERAIRRMWLGNGGIHPAAAFARMFGISLAEIGCIYWRGLSTDPALLAATGNRLKKILEGATHIRVLHPTGTDITVRPGLGSIVVSDGTLPPGTSQTWLPGGEVTLGLDPESAEGRLVVERVFFDGENIGPLSLHFSGGRLQTMASAKDLSSLRELVLSAHPLSDRLTGLKFGLNPDVPDQRVVPFMGAGMFSLSMGRNTHLGGDIDMPFLLFLTLSGSTVEVDGRIVVENGTLRL